MLLCKVSGEITRIMFIICAVSHEITLCALSKNPSNYHLEGRLKPLFSITMFLKQAICFCWHTPLECWLEENWLANLVLYVKKKVRSKTASLVWDRCIHQYLILFRAQEEPSLALFWYFLELMMSLFTSIFFVWMSPISVQGSSTNIYGSLFSTENREIILHVTWYNDVPANKALCCATASICMLLSLVSALGGTVQRHQSRTCTICIHALVRLW